MNRSHCTALALATLLTFGLAGCDGGGETGMPKDIPPAAKGGGMRGPNGEDMSSATDMTKIGNKPKSPPAETAPATK